MPAAVEWISTSEMCDRLDVCRSTLHRARCRPNTMEEGVHFIRKTPSSNRYGRLLWNPDAVFQAFHRIP
jgi:hypothetical protein